MLFEQMIVVFVVGELGFGEVWEEDFEEGALGVFERKGVEALVAVDHFHSGLYNHSHMHPQ